MKTKILTSGFPDGFTPDFARALSACRAGGQFVFVASDFEADHASNDRYHAQCLAFFGNCDIHFEHSRIVDSRLQPRAARDAVTAADVLWLSGGNTIAQFHSIDVYGLIPAMRAREGIAIGMSAGSINMASTAVCVPDRKHPKVEAYEGIGLVDISVEPHYGARPFPDELLRATNVYPLYCLCDNSFILLEDAAVSYSGDIFYVENEIITQISFAGDQ